MRHWAAVTGWQLFNVQFKKTIFLMNIQAEANPPGIQRFLKSVLCAF